MKIGRPNGTLGHITKGSLAEFQEGMKRAVLGAQLFLTINTSEDIESFKFPPHLRACDLPITAQELANIGLQYSSSRLHTAPNIYKQLQI